MKTRSLLTIIALFIFSLPCSAAELVIYKYAGKEHAYTTGIEAVNSYQGQFIYDVAATNGSWVSWGTLHGNKAYWVSPTTNFVAVTIGGAGSKTYTLLAEADSSRDGQGNLILNSGIYKGLNSSLAISSNLSLSFPRILTANETQVGASPTYGQELFQSTANYVFQSALTQASNNANQSVADAVGNLAQSLESQGYQRLD
jgi:hypothetical protein